MYMISATNPVYTSADHSTITADVVFELQPATEEKIAETLGPIPFTASANDVEEHGRIAYQQLANGDFGVVGAYVAPPVPELHIDKLAVINRMTDPELTKLDKLIDKGPIRLKLSWNNATFIRSTDPWHSLLRTEFITEYGLARTNALLAQV